MRFWQDIPRVIAERQMNAALAAAYPHMGEAGRGWWNAMREQANYWSDEQGMDEPLRAPFRFNGIPMKMGRLKKELRQALGAGFSSESGSAA